MFKTGIIKEIGNCCDPEKIVTAYAIQETV